MRGMHELGAPSWATGFDELVEDRPALARAAARWFAPLPSADDTPGTAAQAPGAAGDTAGPAVAARPSDRLTPAVNSDGELVDVPRSIAAELSAIWLLLRLISLPDLAALSPALTPREFASLHLLRTTGPLRVIDVGDLLQMDKSTTSRVIRGLLDRGLVDRAPHPTDGRAFLVALSEAGRALIAEAVTAAGFTLATVLTSWDAVSRATLLDGLLRLRSEWTALLPERWGGNAIGAWEE